MPTELEDLVEFLHHGNTQIRQVAVENLLPYSKTQPAIFKINQLTPVKDLKLLVKDYAPIAKNVLTILINISGDRDVLGVVADDDAFLESLLLRITNVKEPNANEIAMLLANMAKSESIERLLTLKRDVPLGLSASKVAIDQLMDCFVKGAEGSWNPKADFDYLAYLFADLAKFPSGASYLTTIQAYDNVHPLSKLLPFTTPPSSLPRRLGAATVLKNVSFSVSSHPTLLSSPLSVLPYILLPLASGSDNYSESETDQMLEELQFLEPDKKREPNSSILVTHLETLLLLTTTRGEREKLREAGCYFVVRELHLAVEDEGVRESCDRLVQVLMRDEEGEEHTGQSRGAPVSALVTERDGGSERGMMVTQADSEDEDEDEQIVEIF
ncbi:hypothetical protein MMC11_008594 [Xylographa trunciseda]|nr:hypothetical protein [Xylographa trunciseda]